MSDYITLTGDYGFTGYDLSSLVDGGTIDATTASWTVANSRNEEPADGCGCDTGELEINRYPFQVSGADYVTILGGTIDGEVPLGSDWTYTYRDDYPDGESCNSAALRIADSTGATIDGWRISRPWDGIRISGDSDGFVITDVWISQSRDDAIENDDLSSGTIRDSLFDGVFSGISLGDSNAPDHSDHVVTLDGVLLRSESFLYKGEVTHGSPIKMSKDDSITPNLSFKDTIFAIEDVDHFGQERLQKAWDKTIASSGNYFLNLSDDKLPSDYPMPGEGWTVLQGQAARDYWDAAASAWKAEHGGDSVGGDAGPAPEPAPANSDPEAIDAKLTVAADAVLTGQVSAYDADGDPLAFSLLDGPSEGSLVLGEDGAFSYDPAGAFDDLAVGTTSTVTFTCSVSDGNGGSDSAVVDIVVEGQNQSAPSGYNTILGTDASDRLVGTEGDDIFRTGDGGSDTVYGLGGADLLVFGTSADDGVRTMERFKDFDPTEDSLVLEAGAQIEWIHEHDDRLSIKLEGDGDRIYLYGDHMAADDVNIIHVDDLWAA